MKLNPLILAASLAAAMTTVSINASAASDTEKAAEAKGAPTTVQADKASPSDRPSQMQDKTAVLQKLPEAKTVRPNPWKDTSKHFHPRDGK